MEEEHRYLLGEFETLKAAEAACRQVVNRCLEDTFEPSTNVVHAILLSIYFRLLTSFIQKALHFRRLTFGIKGDERSEFAFVR
jgi:hypothetical protein